MSTALALDDPNLATPPFVARRSRLFAGAQAAMAGALVALIGGYVLNQYQAGESIVAAGFLFAVMSFYCWIALDQLRDRSPLLVIDRTGLFLPGVAAAPLAWPAIRRVELRSGFGGARLDVAVDAEVFPQIKVGRRFMGDYVVGRRGWPTGFSILTSPLDRNGRAIHTAIKEFWPPRDEDA